MQKITIFLGLALGLSQTTQAGLLYAANPFPWAVTAPPRALGDMPQPAVPLIRSLAPGTGIYPVHTAAKAKKLGFWNRVALRMTPKKYRAQLYLAMQDTAEADKKAKNSLIIGAIALALSIVPYTFIAAIPLGIIAISMAARARKMGSTKKTGKWLGIAALVVCVVWMLVSAFYTGTLLFGWLYA